MDLEFAHQFDAHRRAQRALREGNNRDRIPTMCIGRVTEDTVAKEKGYKYQDLDIFNGTYVTSAGTYRVLESTMANPEDPLKPHKIYSLVYAKHAATLRGFRYAHEPNVIGVTTSRLEAAHVISAYRYDDVHDNKRFIEEKFAKAMDISTNRALEASTNHYIWTAASYLGNELEAYSNSGYTAYTLNKSVDGLKTLTETTSIRRRKGTENQHGGFLPIHFRNGAVTDLTKLSRTVEKSSDYMDLRAELVSSIYKFSGYIWDEKNIFKEQSLWQRSKKLPLDVINGLPGFARDTAVAAIMTLGYSYIYPNKGIWDNLLYMFSHAAFHKGIELGIENREEMYHRARLANKRDDITQYGFYEDCADFLKNKRDPQNLFRRLPKFDLLKLRSMQNRFCTTKDLWLLPNHTDLRNDLSIANVQSLALLGHQRGHSAITSTLSRNTRLNSMQNGVLNFHQRNDDRTSLTASMYRPEFATTHVQLPEMYAKQYGESHEAMAIYYDRNKPYGQSIQFERGVSPADLVHEFKTRMFMNQKRASKTVRKMSYGVLDHVFNGLANRVDNMQPIPVPYWSAALSDNAVEAYLSEAELRGYDCSVMDND